jgi:hypothetical protein
MKPEQAKNLQSSFAFFHIAMAELMSVWKQLRVLRQRCCNPNAVGVILDDVQRKTNDKYFS